MGEDKEVENRRVLLRAAAAARAAAASRGRGPDAGDSRGGARPGSLGIGCSGARARRRSGAPRCRLRRGTARQGAARHACHPRRRAARPAARRWWQACGVALLLRNNGWSFLGRCRPRRDGGRWGPRSAPCEGATDPLGQTLTQVTPSPTSAS